MSYCACTKNSSCVRCKYYSKYEENSYVGHGEKTHPAFPVGTSPGVEGCCEICDCELGIKQMNRLKIELAILWAFDVKEAYRLAKTWNIKLPSDMDIIRTGL